jgi:hypothetical protein
MIAWSELAKMHRIRTHVARTFSRRSTPALPCPKIPVEPGEIEALRIEHIANPAHHVLVLLVRTVGKNLEE